MDADFFNKTETRLSDFFMCETRPRRDCLIFLCARGDRDETYLKILGETETNPRVSVSFFTRPRQESTINEEIYCIFGKFLLKSTHPDQDETETRLSKN